MSNNFPPPVSWLVTVTNPSQPSSYKAGRATTITITTIVKVSIIGPSDAVKQTISSLLGRSSWLALWLHHHYHSSQTHLRGTRWSTGLRHCATNRKVAGSIADGVTRIFQWLNPSGRIVVLGSTQLLTEMSTRNHSWWVKAAGA
jgi:hypothetical protein